MRAGEQDLLGLGLRHREGEQGLGQLLGALGSVGVGRRGGDHGGGAGADDLDAGQQQPGEGLLPCWCLAASRVPLRKIATLSPGFTKPATREGSERLIEIAILPLGIVRPVLAPVAPNLEAISCSPGVDVDGGDLAGDGLGAGQGVGEEVLLGDRARLDLAGRLGGLDGLAGGDRLDDPQHLDGVVALVGAGVGAPDVQEHQQRAEAAMTAATRSRTFLRSMNG